MSLAPAVVRRIAALGGAGGDLESVTFTAPLLFADWADYAEADVFTALATDASRAAELVRYPALDWEIVRFTPFTPGTPDHAEWGETIDANALAELCGVGAPTVIFVGFSEGWPNCFFTIAEDPQPDNPAIYTTDHEVYFREVEHRGTLLDLLGELLAPEEFDGSVRAALA